MATIWITKRNRGRQRAAYYRTGGFLVSSAKSGRLATDRSQMSIAVRLDAMKAMRWVVGDTIRVGVDLVSKTITLRRGEGGFRLGARVTGKQDSTGLCVPGVIKFAQPEIIKPLVLCEVPLADCLIEGADVVIPVPMEPAE